jgi:hypothetical protein
MKTIGDILEKNSSLKKLVKKTQTTKNLAAIFYSMLDSDFAKNCHFANFRDSVLTITVTNAAWATKLRYAIPDIIKNLCTQLEFKKLVTIRYVINQQKYPIKTKKIQTKLSHGNELLWQETLDSLKKNTKNRSAKQQSKE